MNTSALKTFAPTVRTQLMEAVTRKLDFALTAQTPDYLTTFAPQVAELRKLAQADRAGLIERVAYTWFNRFAALRFMDAHGWHPFRARVLTPASAAETQPELLKLTRTGALPEELKSHTNPQRLNDLLDGRIPSTDPQGEVYRHLVLAACRFYHALLPNLFEKLDDETELLLPDDLLTEHSVVHGFRTEISDEDCGDGQRANVEILGWLYQFYISERKDQVMARKSAVPTKDIPAVTQLFTPHWIVRYLVENSLGRLWLLNRPGSRLREHMPFYIEGEAETDFLKITKPEEIRLCDPAVGSGHMLTYAFDLLTLIYEEEGYAPTEIPALILRHNLHGLEICPRAAQLAELALVFKARHASRRFFQLEHFVRPQIIELKDVKFEDGELADYFKAIGINASSFIPHTSSFPKLLHQFKEAKNFGSLIQPCLGEAEIQTARAKIQNSTSNIQNSDLMVGATHLKVLRVLEQAEALTQRYHVVVANPPYKLKGDLNGQLQQYMENHYPKSKGDLFGCFVERGLALVFQSGLNAMVTMQAWLFIDTFKDLRAEILNKHQIVNLVQIGFNSFPELNSKFALAAAFIIRKNSRMHLGHFMTLNHAPKNADKEKVFFDQKHSGAIFRVDSQSFKLIEGMPISFEASEKLKSAFSTCEQLRNVAEPRQGMATGDNDRFVRCWFEVCLNRIGIGFADKKAASDSRKKWFPYNKGGGFRKWYGNQIYIVDWEKDGERIQNFTDSNGKLRSRPQNKECYFKESITWSLIGLTFGPRHTPTGFLFDVGGSSAFPPKDKMHFVIAFLASKISSECLLSLNPTLNYQVGDIQRLPIKFPEDPLVKKEIEKIAAENIGLSRDEWDNFETSWDFRDQPLLRPGLKGATLEASWRNWEAQSTGAIRRMQELETENNRLFIAAYGLDGELQPEVPEAQITLARAEARRDMAAFLSYAVGCMMGRYSPDHPGLILASAGDSLREFLEKVGKPLAELTFAPDEDGIIPVLDGEWFEDDIVARTRDFLRATFGEATLRENLRFIEDSLDKDLRKYFLNDFYKDHLQTYKKRPIYWMVQSPKKGFSVLLYMHRYTRDTMNLVLNRYLRDYHVKLRNRLTHLAEVQTTAATAKTKTEARKEADKLTKTLRECEDWERQTVLPLAQARIELDLDDGVKTNYLKLGEALAPIAGLAAKDED